MIITVSELLDSGLAISDEVSDSRLEYAITAAEQYIVKPRLGQLYIDITENPDNYRDILEGGLVTDGTRTAYLAGLKLAMCELAFAELLMNSANATAFGAVYKKDDYSDGIQYGDSYTLSKMHGEKGLAYLAEITSWLSIDGSGNGLPNWQEEHI